MALRGPTRPLTRQTSNYTTKNKKRRTEPLRPPRIDSRGYLFKTNPKIESSISKKNIQTSHTQTQDAHRTPQEAQEDPSNPKQVKLYSETIKRLKRPLKAK